MAESSAGGTDRVAVGVVNVNSLRNKLAYVWDLIGANGLSVLGICETWLTKDTPSSFVDIEGYRFFRRDVEGTTRKHGVGLYINKDLSVVPDEIDVPNVLSVYVPGWEMHILICYRPPSYSALENEILMQFIEDFCSSRHVLVMGDFNLPSLSWPVDGVELGYVTPFDRSFCDLFMLLGLTQHVHSPTFFPSGSVLDLLLCSESESVGDVTVCLPFPGCHHSPVLVDLFFTPSEGASRCARLWFKGNFDCISEELFSLDWRTLFEGLSVEDCYSLFLENLYGLIDRYVPVSSADRKNPSWMNPPPQSLVRRRREAWSTFKELRREHGRSSDESVEAWEVYASLNSEFRNYSKNKQWEYEENLIRRLSTAPKLFHGYIRRKKKGRPPVGPLKVGGVMVSDAGQMAEVLADTFVAVFDESRPLDLATHQTCDAWMDPLSLNYDMVYSVQRNLDGESSPGPDNVHSCLLKKCAAALAYPLTIIYQRSLASACLPVVWKESFVVPLYKSGSRSDPSNYRPVSLTSVCCKVFERMISDHIMSYLEEHNLLSSRQYGFRKSHSTEDQLLLMYGQVSKWVDSGEVVDLIYLDFSKAFYVVCHSLIVSKLRLLGFDDELVCWVQEFLRGRRFSILLEGRTGLERRVSSGVPQGSVLGPVLFLIYANFVMSEVGSLWVAFADDFKLGVAYQRSERGRAGGALQDDLDSIVRISSSWNLRLNPSKCVVMRFGRGCAREVSEDDTRYHINGHELEFVSTYRDLGVIVDTDLRFHAHISTVVGKAGALMGDLLRSTICRSIDFMVSLFVSHIRPLLDYCSAVWNVGYLTDMRRLESLQRRWTREVAVVGALTYVERLKKLGMFSVWGRLLRADLIKIWKVWHGYSHSSLLELFELSRSSSTRGHSLKLAIPVCRTDVLRRSLGVRRVYVWNSLPAPLVESESLEGFKRGLDEFMGDRFHGVL